MGWRTSSRRTAIVKGNVCLSRPAKATMTLTRQPLPPVSGLPSRSRSRHPLVWRQGWRSQTWTPQHVTPAAASRLESHPVLACAGSHTMDGMAFRPTTMYVEAA